MKINTQVTQVQVTKKTREKLQKIRLTERESYDEIIKRLIKNYKEAAKQ